MYCALQCLYCCFLVSETNDKRNSYPETHGEINGNDVDPNDRPNSNNMESITYCPKSKIDSIYKRKGSIKVRMKTTLRLGKKKIKVHTI